MGRPTSPSCGVPAVESTGVQREFQPAIEEALALCSARFGGRLRATYLSGSVAFGEAWPGASDVDWFMFMDSEPREDDLAWCEDQARSLTETHAAVGKFTLNLHSIKRLEREAIWRFILRYNSVRLTGPDLLAELEERDLETPAPTKDLAQSRAAWMERLTDATEQGRFSEAAFPLPDNSFLATRKLARWLVLVEGAHVLMADGAFVSFRQPDVLRQLRSCYPTWEDLWAKTTMILRDPFAAGIAPDGFIPEAVAFLRWGISRIKNAVSRTGPLSAGKERSET